jgi:hypothetical protein
VCYNDLNIKELIMPKHEKDIIKISPNYGAITHSFTNLADGKKFQIDGGIGFDNVHVKSLFHGFSTTGGILPDKNFTHAAIGYNQTNITETGYFTGQNIKIMPNINLYTQTKILGNENIQLNFNTGINYRLDITSNSNLNPSGLYNDVKYEFNTTYTGPNGPVPTKDDNNLLYNRYLYDTKNIEFKTPTHHINTYATLNIAGKLGEYSSYNIGGGITTSNDLKLKPIITANYAHETINGGKFEIGASYTLPYNDRLLDNNKFRTNALEYSSPYQEGYELKSREFIRKLHDTVDPVTFRGTSDGQLKKIENPIAEKFPNVALNAMDKQSFGQFSAHISMETAPQKLGKSKTMDFSFFAKAGISYNATTTNLEQNNLMHANQAGFYEPFNPDNISVQNNLYNDTSSSFGVNISGGLKIGFGRKSDTPCPLHKGNSAQQDSKEIEINGFEKFIKKSEIRALASVTGGTHENDVNDLPKNPIILTADNIIKRENLGPMAPKPSGKSV